GGPVSSACTCGFPLPVLVWWLGYGHDRRQAAGPPKMSMVPSASVTTARLVSLRLPIPDRVRRVLPGRLIVFTALTLTPKTFSTAILISVLLARGSTRKVYLPSSRRP